MASVVTGLLAGREGSARANAPWLVCALVLLAVLGVADATFGAVAGTFVIAPLVLAVAGAPRLTALLSAAAVAMAALSGVHHQNFGEGDWWVRLAFVAVGGVLAVVAAERRCRAELAARRTVSQDAVAGLAGVAPTAVIGMDAAGRVTSWNPAAAELLGRGAEDTIGRELAELVVPPELRAAHRAGLQRVLAGGPSQVLGQRLEVEALHATGARIPVELSITRLPGPEPAFAGFLRDLTAERRRALQQHLLSRTGELLASSTDYERMLREVAELAVPGLADWAGVALPGRDGRLDSVAVAHTDPAKLQLAHELRRDYPAPPERDPLRAVMATGEPIVHAAVGDDELRAHARDERHLELLRAVGLASVLMVPMLAGRRTVGTLTFARSAQGHPFDDEDLALAIELGRRAGLAVETARLYAERSEVAATLSAALQPPELPAMPGWDLASLFRPAGRADEVGGDFYDTFPVPGGWVLVVGDVAGKGAPAAALTSLARWSIRTAATLTGSPAAALAHLNADLAAQGQTALISAVCVRLDDHDGRATATIATAGHPLPVLVHEGCASETGRPGLLLGVDGDASYADTTVPLGVDDRLVLYTDGVTDLRGPEDRFGADRLLAALDVPAPTAEQQLRALDARLAAFADGEQPDDIAALAVRRTGAPVPVLAGR